MDLFSNDIIQSKNQRSFYICGYKDELHNLGFSVESLPKRTMPTSYNNWDKTEKLSFLKGMFSANGSVVKNHRIQYKSTCKKLILELQKALLDFEINTNITINKAYNNTFSNGTYLCKESYDLCINQLSSIIKFSELINFVHKYKQESLEELISTRSFMIISVTKIGKEKVFDFTENNNHWGMVNGCVVHNCAEEPLPAGGSCLLGSINLAEFVKNPFTKEAKVNYIGLISTVHKAVRALNDVLQEGKFLHPLEEQIEAVSKWKQIGLGTMGLADMLIKLGVEYGDIDSLMFIHNVYKTIAEAAVIESANIAIETKSPYEDFDFEAFKESDFINNLSLPKAVLSRIKRYGMYNSQLLTCAPTGSIATMLGVSTGIEPIYAMKYTRTTKSLEGKDNIFEIYTPIAKNYLQTHNNLPDYFVESKDISPSDRIRVQAQIQDFIDASISSTINLPKEATVEDIYNIYINAWKCNTKGVTVYRNGCAREGILNTEKIVKEVPNRQAPKRPKSIPAKVEVVKIKGELFAVFIGFYEDKPYEIFTSKVDEHFTPEEGVIIKKSKGLYAFESANYRDIALMQTSSFEEKAATLYTSMLLRHGVNIKYIIKTAKKVNNNITSFSSAMCRVLSKYIPNEEIKGEVCPDCGSVLIRENGCVHCSSCGWSRCS
jgi:ribonucleotide reductase alpha subunit